MEAGNYIETIENRQGLKVCCPEEIAHFNGWIDDKQLMKLAEPLAKTSYGQYLRGLVRDGRAK
jgi:glucose-1-phosphate thymidylyltransferase